VTNGQVNRTGTGKLAWRFTIILGSKPLWETGEMGRRGHEKQMTKNRETLKKKTTLPHLPPPCIHDRHTERQRVRHSLPTKEDRTPQDKVGAGTTPCPPHSAVTTVLTPQIHITSVQDHVPEVGSTASSSGGVTRTRSWLNLNTRVRKRGSICALPPQFPATPHPHLGLF
jgi:hypothetical protein